MGVGLQSTREGLAAGTQAELTNKKVYVCVYCCYECRHDSSAKRGKQKQQQKKGKENKRQRPLNGPGSRAKAERVVIVLMLMIILAEKWLRRFPFTVLLNE